VRPRLHRDRISIRVYRAPAPGLPPPPDPLAESRQRRAQGWAAARALGPERSLSDMSERFTRSWPDPHGPDVTVFGPPR
jgi:hypothetical protein